MHNILLVKHITANDQALQVPLNHVEAWIQVHNLPIGFMFERVVRDVGNYINEFLKSYKNNFIGIWRKYL